MPKPRPFVVKPGDHEPLQVVGETITVLAAADRTRTLSAGDFPPTSTERWA